MADQRKWFVHFRDNHQGPFTLEDVRQMLTRGEYTPANYAWAEGMDTWKPLAEIPEFQDVVSKKTPLTAKVTGKQELSALLEVNNTFDDPTSALDVGKLKNAKRAAALASRQERKATRVSEEPHSRAKGLLWFLVFALVLGGGGFAAYKSGKLDRLFSAIPKVTDVSPSDSAELRLAAETDPSAGPKLALALVIPTGASPVFYVSSNLPDRTRLKLVLVADPSTLATDPVPEITVPIELSKHLTRTGPIQPPNGQLLPKGEYSVTVSDEGQRTSLKKTYFLGGAKDEAYLKSLNESHKRYRDLLLNTIKSMAEIARTMESRLTDLSTAIDEIRKIRQKKLQEKRWASFQQTWEPQAKELKGRITAWKEKKESRVGAAPSLGNLAEKALQDLQQAVDLHQLSFTQGTGIVKINDPTLTPQSLVTAKDSVDQLKTQVDSALKAPEAAVENRK